MSNTIKVAMRCPDCEGKLYPVEDSKFLWIQCGVCGKKSLAIEKEGMWGD
jgi:Zn finger protein HypA/HybF involved in hydrogenase expression